MTPCFRNRKHRWTSRFLWRHDALGFRYPEFSAVHVTTRQTCYTVTQAMVGQDIETDWNSVFGYCKFAQNCIQELIETTGMDGISQIE